MSLKEYNYSATELLDAVDISFRIAPKMKRGKSGITIGRALEYVTELGVRDKDFQGDCDGIDAMCYHLSKYTIQDAIDTLQKVLKRFETDKT